MNAEDVKHVGHGEEPMVVPDDEADEAASHIAGMTVQEEPAIRLIKSQLDLFKYLINKAQAANDLLLSRHPAMESLRSDAERLRSLSELIAQVESDDYMCRPGDQEKLQHWMNRLTSKYAGGAETDERIARVIALERSLGLGDTT